MKVPAALLLFAALASADDAASLLRDALVRLEALKTGEAEDLLTRAIKLEPRMARLYYARARLREESGRDEHAARDFERASRLGEDHWRRAAALYSMASAHDEAAHAYEQVWKRSKELDDLVAVADARASAGQVESAILVYDEAIRRAKPMQAVGYLTERARLRSSIGYHAEALRDVSLAIQRIPRSRRAYQIRGRILLRQGRTKEGIDSFKTALGQLSAHPSSYWIIGLAYYDTGDWKRAVESFERSIGFEDEVHEYTHLYLFLARCRLGDPAGRMRAARELMRFLENREEEEDWLAKVGAFLTGSMSRDELLEAARLGNKHTQREHLCEAYAYIAARDMIARQPDRARESFRKAVATGVVSYVEYNTAVAELRRVFREDAIAPRRSPWLRR